MTVFPPSRRPSTSPSTRPSGPTPKALEWSAPAAVPLTPAVEVIPPIATSALPPDTRSGRPESTLMVMRGRVAAGAAAAPASRKAGHSAAAIRRSRTEVMDTTTQVVPDTCASVRGGRLLPRARGRLEHPVQMRRGLLDVTVLVLAGTRLGRQHPAAMHALEVSVGEPVAALVL